METNEFENTDNETKSKENSSDESSDTPYKNRFRFKKSSIQIKKNSLLKTKIKNANLEGTTQNDSALGTPVQLNNKDDQISSKENNVITNDIPNEELEKDSIKKNSQISQNSRNKKASVEFTKLVSIQKKNIKNGDENVASGIKNGDENVASGIKNGDENVASGIKNGDENITNEIKNDKKKEKNVLLKSKQLDELNPLSNDKSKCNNTNIKNPLESASNLNKSKTDNQTVNKKNEIHKSFLKNKQNLVNNNTNQIDTQNNSPEVTNFNTPTDKSDESPLALLKKHGKLIKYINEIHMTNSEEIINLRNEFSTIKSDLNKIMNIISVSQKAVSSLK
ncbi:conserved Plasmodium protein, unknown function [Plasmodium chabaudi chabaudi]|uniref:Uncharacterized protein n=1 Tax=Plasmodium chabaudi chabaudi TaxID=31271 RepID=A0A4V0K4Y0_PLACU|nr:conserved Plasmodium protein, unknown function [Plasmodium chabaudi chabaudi]VTZ67930.1 conserved Plasmodium protein, unknown function [Plasmodium chabaudi chabaudi]|eukprot:XP_735834.2 conserved Plasmodium protein, unknown function [Plasmodium chabaudi chabaudi]